MATSHPFSSTGWEATGYAAITSPTGTNNCNKNDNDDSSDDDPLYRDFSNIDTKGHDHDASFWANRGIALKDPPFPMKLHSILSNPSLSDIITWHPHGRSWRVLKKKDFEEKVLHYYFSHKRFASFVAQVNGYGFRRVTSGIDLNSYYHELFLRGMPHLCSRMRRLSTQDLRDRKKMMENTQPPDFYALNRENPLPTGTKGSCESDTASANDTDSASAKQIQTQIDPSQRVLDANTFSPRLPPQENIAAMGHSQPSVPNSTQLPQNTVDVAQSSCYQGNGVRLPIINDSSNNLMNFDVSNMNSNITYGTATESSGQKMSGCSNQIVCLLSQILLQNALTPTVQQNIPPPIAQAADSSAVTMFSQTSQNNTGNSNGESNNEQLNNSVLNSAADTVAYQNQQLHNMIPQILAQALLGSNNNNKNNNPQGNNNNSNSSENNTYGLIQQQLVQLMGLLGRSGNPVENNNMQQQHN